MKSEALLTEIGRIAREADATELPALLGRLAEAEAVVRIRLSMAAIPADNNGNTPERLEPETWLTPDQASRIAGVNRRTIYDWASGKSWAARPSRRCLRIAERTFRRWLAAR